MIDQEPKPFFLVQTRKINGQIIVGKLPLDKMSERLQNHPFLKGIAESTREWDPTRPIGAIIFKGREPVRVLPFQVRITPTP